MIQNIKIKNNGKYLCTVFEINKDDIVKLTFPLIVESKPILNLNN